MKQRTLVIAALILLAAAGASVFIVVQQRAMRQEFERAMAEWKASGGRESLLALKPPTLPDDENAATLYNRAFAMIAAMPKGSWQAVGDPDAEDGLREATMEALAPAIELALEAAHMERCFWSEELYEEPYTALMTWLGSARQLTHVLIDHARSEADAGRTLRAAESLHAALALSNHIAADPVLISMLVQWAIQTNALDALQEIFRDRDRQVPPHLIEPLLREIDGAARLAATYEADALSLLHVINERDVDIIAMEGIGEPSPGLYLRAWWFRDLDRAFALDFYRKAIETTRTPFHLRQPVGDPVDFPASAVFTQVMLPMVGRPDSVTMQAEAHRLLAIEAIRLRAHRSVHGAYPAPEEWPMPPDPTSGGAMTYELTEEGFILRTDPAGAADRTWEWE